jgi:sarcosine oxidase
MTRRKLLQHLATTTIAGTSIAGTSIAAASKPLTASAVPLISPAQSTSIVVVGAGVFGLWTALTLLRAGAKVMLVDAFGVGNVRASSSDETHMIRAAYGSRSALYAPMTVRSLQLWREAAERARRTLLIETGCLWLQGSSDGENDRFFRQSINGMRENGLAFDEIDTEELLKRYPIVSSDGIRRAFIEPRAGYLLARRCMDALLEMFVAEGGEYRAQGMKSRTITAGEVEQIQLADGATLKASQFVFACGAWLGEMFPDALETLIRPSRQEVFYFGLNFDDRRVGRLPAWVDMTNDKALFYGIPGTNPPPSDARTAASYANSELMQNGFKIADDTHGGPFNPTTGERLPSEEQVSQAKRFLAMRFPAIKNAALIHAKVCQYENSPDGNLIIDRLPEASNTLVIGGGSGHGFKHAPAVAELAAGILLHGKQTPKEFSLIRFKQ